MRGEFDARSHDVTLFGAVGRGTRYVRRGRLAAPPKRHHVTVDRLPRRPRVVVALGAFPPGAALPDEILVLLGRTAEDVSARLGRPPEGVAGEREGDLPFFRYVKAGR
jgi:hypothetical protein